MEVALLAFSSTSQCKHYYTLENPLLLGALGLTAFNHPWIYQVSYIFLVSTSVPLVLSRFLAEHVTHQFRPLVVVAQCWFEASQLSTFLNISEYIPHQFNIVKDLIRDVLVGQVLMGLPLLQLTLWLLRDTFCANKGYLHQSHRQWWGDSITHNKGLPAILERMGMSVCSRGCNKQCHICPEVS